MFENFFQTEIPSSEANRLTSKYVEFFVTEKRSPSSIQEDWPYLWPSLNIYFPHQTGSAEAKAAKKN